MTECPKLSTPRPETAKKKYQIYIIICSLINPLDAMFVILLTNIYNPQGMQERLEQHTQDTAVVTSDEFIKAIYNHMVMGNICITSNTYIKANRKASVSALLTQPIKI